MTSTHIVIGIQFRYLLTIIGCNHQDPVVASFTYLVGNYSLKALECKTLSFSPINLMSFYSA